MRELLPDDENVRRAVKWISGHLQENPNHPIRALVQEAIFKFDLSPRDADFLTEFYRTRNDER